MFKKSLLFIVAWLCFAVNVFAADLADHFVNVNNTKIHYYQMGSGTPIILLTGHATTSNFWNNDFVRCLAKKHAVYLIDYKGINVNNIAADVTVKDMATQIINTQKKLALGKAAVIGWSMGGSIALEMAHDFPEKVSQLILLAPLTPHGKPTGLVKPPEHLNNAVDVLNYVLGNNIYQYSPNERMHYENDLLAPNKTLFPNKMINTDQRTAMKNWQLSSETWNNFSTTLTPALFIVSDHDKILNSKSIQQDAQAYPHAMVIVAKNSSHDVSLQHPQWTCDEVNHFLD